ncbi:MAG: PD40 domain-containing protein [Clostridia bacterium]|nr:PD40 domain-containing protein [Clostridia bacterium]
MKKLIVLLCVLLIGCQNKTHINAASLVSNGTENEALNEIISDEIVLEEQIELKTEPILLPRNEILFSSERGGDRDLYLTSAYQDNPILLLDLPSHEGHGDWAPDGYKIAFFSDMDGDRDIYMMDLREENPEILQLTNVNGENHFPDWSPDGKYIVFESNRFGQSDIFIMNSDGSNQTLLTNSAYDEKAPKFSSDGKKIGFTTIIDGMPYYGSVEMKFETQEVMIESDISLGYIDYNEDDSKIVCHKENDLYELDIQNNLIKKILDDASRTLWVPVYSPDHKWIAYDSEGAYGTGEIYIRELETGETFEITHDPSSDWGPDWRPEPKINQVLYDSDVDGDREIYIKDLDLNKTIQLTDNTYEDGLASWNFEGNRIVFFSNRDGDDEIYVMDSNGENVKQLTHNDVEDRTPSWSRDNQYIAYASMENGNYDIFMMNSDGTGKKQLTFESKKEFWTTWSLDGKWVYYTSFGMTQDTYAVNVETLETRLVWENCSRIEFSPDGKKVAYSQKDKDSWNIYIRNLESNRVDQMSSSRSDEWVPTWSPNGDSVVFSRENGYEAAIVEVNINTYDITGVVPLKGQNWRPMYKPKSNH